VRHAARSSTAGSGGNDTAMPSMFVIHTSSLTHWWTMCSCGVRALGSGRNAIRASAICDQTLSVFNRSVR
jgi:hypothetical protein